jgi:very-short-patch-repair endonuclease
VLACGDGAVLSHGSAAYAWDLPGGGGPVVDVSVPGAGGRRGHAGVRVHRAASLARSDRTTVDGLPATTVERTLLDLATTLAPRRLAQAVEAAEARGLLDHAKLVTTRRAGAARLRAATQAPPALTRSELEDRFLALCARHRLPRPRVNQRVGPFEVDFHWPEQALVVETDGFATHRTRSAFEEDRRRDQVLASLGIHVVRVTHRQVTREAGRVAAVLRTRLG